MTLSHDTVAAVKQPNLIFETADMCHNAPHGIITQNVPAGCSHYYTEALAYAPGRTLGQTRVDTITNPLGGQFL